MVEQMIYHSVTGNSHRTCDCEMLQSFKHLNSKKSFQITSGRYRYLWKLLSMCVGMRAYARIAQTEANLATFQL